MGARITQGQREMFYRFLGEGHNVKAAAMNANVSYSWAKNNLANLPSKGLALKEAKKAASLHGPIPFAKLKPEAKRALDDFEYFRRRYFGHVSQPWHIEAAKSVVDLLSSPHKEYVVMNEPPGTGKALALDTPLPTPGGWTTMKDVQIGDWLLDERGFPCQVTYKSPVFYGHDCYEVRTDDGASVIADADHLWPVQLERGPVKNRTTADLAQKRGKRPMLPVAKNLYLPEADLPIDPYVLGAWLGDGHSDSARMVAHPDDAPHFIEQLHRARYETTVSTHRNLVHIGFSAPIDTCSRGHNEWSPSGNCRPCNTIAARAKRTGESMPPVVALTPQGWLRHLDLLGNKHIPATYLRAAYFQRLALLQGLVDTDGYVAPDGRVEFTSTSRALADGTLELVRSLGIKASFSEGRATIDGRDCGPKYRIGFYRASAARLQRKYVKCRDAERTPSRYLTVTPVESVPTQCIQVDSPNHLYLAGTGFMVTHNTTLVHDIACWVIVRRRDIRVLMGSATSKKAETMQKRVRRSLERVTPTRASAEDKERGLACDSEATLCVDFGLFKPATGGDLWRADSFIVLQHGDEMIDEKEPTCSAYGMDQDFLGGRYDLIFWDDLVTMKHVKTMEQVEQQREWWDREAESRLEPGGALFLVGQRVASNDLYRHCLDKKLLPEDDDDFEQAAAAALTAGEDEKVADLPTKYTHVVYRAHDEIRCQGEHKVDAPAWPDGCLLDPRRLTWRELRAIRANDAAVYATWYQQEDADPLRTLVKSVWVTGGTDPETGTYHPGCWDKDRELCELPQGLVGPKFSIVGVDPSPSKMWAIGWWVYAPEADHQLFLMDTIRRSMPANELLDWNANSGQFYGVLDEWQQRSVALGLPITHFVVEVNAAQRFLLQYDHVRRWVAQNKTNIIPHTTTIRKHDADMGIDMTRDWWRYGRIRLPGKGQGRIAALKLVEEVQKYPNAYFDDQVHMHWFVVKALADISAGWEIKEPPKFARPSWMQNTDRGFVRV